MVNYDWPGNVRELENVIERACVFATSERLTKELFPEKLFLPPAPLGTQSADDVLFPLEEAEKRAIFMAIMKAQGNKSLAAKYLGISRSTLYEKMKRLNIV
jgi:transcriptional regulator of acetoin/glycerol metabolism